MSKRLVFSALNRHSSQCGEPPAIRTRKALYCSYFENDLSEQWVFTFDTKKHEAKLRGGDCKWPREFLVKVTAKGEIRGLPVLRPVELQWVRACLVACGVAKG